MILLKLFCPLISEITSSFVVLLNQSLEIVKNDKMIESEMQAKDYNRIFKDLTSIRGDCRRNPFFAKS